MRLFFVIASLWIASCAASRPVPPAPAEAAPAESSAPVSAPGGACTQRSDCPEGTTCQGPEGCGAAWTCGPARPCTRDLVTFCGCDGTTFRSSSTCPARPYAHRGECP